MLMNASSLKRHLTDGYENIRHLTDACGHIYKKKIIFVIFGRFKKGNPRAVGIFHQILDRNVVVTPQMSNVDLHLSQNTNDVQASNVLRCGA